jgi:hypothetical protein
VTAARTDFLVKKACYFFPYLHLEYAFQIKRMTFMRGGVERMKRSLLFMLELRTWMLPDFLWENGARNTLMPDASLKNRAIHRSVRLLSTDKKP